MAKAATKRKKVENAASVVAIRYDLFDLPTAQHKAGLAGLVLQIRSMERDRKFRRDEIPRIVEVTTTTATFEFSEQSVQTLFDDVYAAEIVEVAVRQKWQGEKPKAEKEVSETDESGKVTKSKRYIYEVVQPTGRFLKNMFRDEDGLWLKLWRNMLWEIPRSRPTTRIPFNQRVEGEHCSEGANAWQDLLAFEKARAKNSFKTAAVSSALLLGAQAVNAESIPFEGRVEQSFLLHFWPLSVLIFVPQRITNDGESEFVGYTLAIPEVSDLECFCEDYPQMLRELNIDAHGYRPAEAVIDIPEQSALEFMEHLARLTHQATGRKKIRHSISSVEFMHLVKVGNNVKSMAGGRIAPREDLLEDYRAITRRKGSPYRNLLFRAALLRALLRGCVWYTYMGDLFAQRPWPFFVRCDETPKRIPWFSADAANKFQQLLQELAGRKEETAMTTTTESPPKTPLELLVYRLVRNYVRQKVKDKTNLEWSDFGDKKVKDEKSGTERVDVPSEYREAREKVASAAFLALRSRRERDFADYFTSSICQVGQFLREDEFQLVAQALLNRPEDVKTLALLALSANS